MIAAKTGRGARGLMENLSLKILKTQLYKAPNNLLISKRILKLGLTSSRRLDQMTSIVYFQPELVYN